MGRGISYCVYRAVVALARLVFPRPEFEGLENLPGGNLPTGNLPTGNLPAGCVIVGNHAKMNGPVYAELYLPGPRAIWCEEEMMHLKEVPAYAYADFWSHKPRVTRWFYRALSYVIAPVSVSVFNNAHCIGVYRDARVMGTMRETVKRMQAGERIVIFPEHDVPGNGLLWEFQQGFVDVARLYARRTGQPVYFVPMYVAPRLKKVALGAPIEYDPKAAPAEEQARICNALSRAITDLALAQPPHTVVPYPNMPEKRYPRNILPEKDRRP